MFHSQQDNEREHETDQFFMIFSIFFLLKRVGEDSKQLNSLTLKYIV